MHSLSTLCLLSIPRTSWESIDHHVHSCLYPGVVHLNKLINMWMYNRRMQMEAIEHLVDILGGIDLKPTGTDKGHEVTDPWALHKGDHVIVSKGQVYHHGIYIGSHNGHACCLAEMGMEGVRIVQYPEFMRGYHTYFTVSYNATKEAASRATAVELAIELSVCPISQLMNKYHLLGRNCECFAWFCKTGGDKQSSDQVEAIMQLIQKDIFKKESAILSKLHKSSKGSCCIS